MVLLLLVIMVIWFLIIITGNGYTFLFATSGNIGYVATDDNGYALLSFATGDNGYTFSPATTYNNNSYALSWSSDEIIDGIVLLMLVIMVMFFVFGC